MIPVLFDLLATQPLAGYRFHGGAEYTKQVFRHALAVGYRDFDAIYDPAREFDPLLLELCSEHGIGLFEVAGWSGAASVMADGRYSTFFSGLPYEYADVDTGGIRFVMTIHGLRTLEMPVDPSEVVNAEGWLRKCWLFTRNTRRAKRRVAFAKQKLARLLFREGAVPVTSSRHSKYSLRAFFPESELPEVQVFHAPVDELLRFAPAANNNRGDYYLLLAGDRWVKNALSACRAIDSLISDGLLQRKRAIVLGVVDSLAFSRKLANATRFEFRDYVERDELAALIQGAYCLVFPSLNEGFGYPPLNAMELGTPVVASSISSIPEVCGDAALYFDPCSQAEMRNRLLQVDEDEELYVALVAGGRQHFARMKKIETKMMDELVALIFDSR